MDIYLLRHGETDWNRQGRLQGRTDIGLNETGRRQVARAAEALAQVCPRMDLIVSSPLSRAYESAGIAARKLHYKPDAIRIEEGLIERCYGKGEGLTAARRADLYPDRRYPGMEPDEAVQERGRLALGRIVAAAGTKDAVLIVAHGALLKGMVTALTAGTPARKEWGIFGNGSVHRIRLRSGQAEVEDVFVPDEPYSLPNTKF